MSPLTVQKAIQTLIGRGLIETRPGAGTFTRRARSTHPADFSWQTAALGPQPTRPLGPAAALRFATTDAIALHSGYPDRELLPERLLRSAFARAARGDAIVDRPPTAGLPELRAWFAADVAEHAPPDATPPAAADVMVLPGSQSGLAAAFRALGGTHAPVLIESPTYWGAITAAARAGVRLVPVPTGPGGPDLHALTRALTETGARAFYAQPTFANPTGTCWSPAVADGVLDLIGRHGAFLIEDDWARDLAIGTPPPPLAARDDAGHVVYIRSLTKSVSPAVRVAAIIARGPAKERILAELETHTPYVSAVLQRVAHDVVTQPAWRTHVRGLRRQLAARRDLLLGALADHLPDALIHAVPAGGLNLWVRLPDTTDLAAAVKECEARGVLVAAGDEWFPTEPTGRYLRLNYAGPNPAAFPAATRIIAEALTATGA